MSNSDLEYLRKAYQYAMKFSTDPSTQNGAILVDDNGEVLVYAANHFPEGVSETPERWQRPLKYQYVEHAERNVIYSAAAEGIKTKGLTMYVPWFACADCGRAIIQAKIGRVVGHDSPIHKTRPDWEQSIQVAMGMFKERGLQVEYIAGPMDGIEIRFDSKIVTP